MFLSIYFPGWIKRFQFRKVESFNASELKHDEFIVLIFSLRFSES